MKTHTHTFLSPMSADGKTPGAVMEMEFESEPVKYLEPLVENDATAKARRDLHEARAKLQHAKSRGKGVAEAQKSLEAAKAAVGKIHHDQQKAREQQRTGIDHGAPSPLSRDTRQFMEPADYSVNDADDNDTSGRTFDNDDELEAKIRAAVDALEQAQSKGASPAKMQKLAEALKVLRDQLPNPSAPPAQTKAAPPRKEHITQPTPTQGPSSQAARQVKTGGWNKFLAALDVKLAKQRKALQSTHSTDVCCEGAYKCARCKAKAAV